MAVTLKQLAELVGGELVGEGDFVIPAARTLSEAGPGDLTYVDGPKQFHLWQDSQAAAAVVPANITINTSKPLIRCADALQAFTKIVKHFKGIEPLQANGEIHPSAYVHSSAIIGEGTRVGPFAVINEGVVIGKNGLIHSHVVVGRFSQIGDDVTLHPQVVLYEGTRLGNRVIVHAHAVIGSDGFGYRTQAGKHVKVEHLGHVELGDDVEIGACTTIDRGTFGPTRIGSGTKIDNLVQIAHNCQIGPGNLFASQVGLSGSVTTGAYVVMGGQVGIADHVQIGEQAMIGAQSGTASNLPGKTRLLGSPAIPVEQMVRVYATMPKIPEMRRDLNKIKKHLGLDENQ